MKKGDELVLTIKDIRFNKEERMMQSNTFGSYASNYVARFVEYSNSIADVDSLAVSLHPDWENKTENRADILSLELAGRKVTVRIKDVFAGKDCFEAVIR